MEPIRLIIIDQHSGVRNALRVRLRSTPNVVVVGTVAAEKALKAAKEMTPDVALLGLTGHNDELRVIVRLVEQLVEQGTAVLALSSYIDDLAREVILRAGASDYRLKNINTPELIAEIELLADSNRKEQHDNL